MGVTQQYQIASLGLSGTQYTVEQTGTDANFRPAYEARDVTGDTIFPCTYRMYEGSDTFAFVDTDGTELFTVEASGRWDIAGEYVLTDHQTGDDPVILDNDVSLLQDTWRLRDPADESCFAEINARGTLSTVARKLVPLGRWLGHTFTIVDADDNSIGTIESAVAVFDEYDITISDPSSVPVGPTVAATVVIDALQQN